MNLLIIFTVDTVRKPSFLLYRANRKKATHSCQRTSRKHSRRLRIVHLIASSVYLTSFYVNSSIDRYLFYCFQLAFLMFAPFHQSRVLCLHARQLRRGQILPDIPVLWRNRRRADHVRPAQRQVYESRSDQPVRTVDRKIIIFISHSSKLTL